MLTDKKKYQIIGLITLLLIIPIFFGVYVESISVKTFNLIIFLTLIAGLFIVFAVGELADIYVLTKESLNYMKEHDVLQALINKENRFLILVLFIITMVMEELIFRFYVIGFLAQTLGLSIPISLFISSIAFSLYHIHTWLTYKDIRISVVYISNSFLLGLFVGFIFITLGIIFSIIFHSILAFLFYFNLYKRYFKEEIV
jgi:membrane protease YdiL (CAAX protease family)